MSDRSNLPRTSHGYSSLTEAINVAMKKFSEEIDALKSQLEKENDSVTQGERDRRFGLMSVLVSQENQLKSILAQSSVSAEQRAEERKRHLLFSDGAGVADLGDVRWGASSASNSKRGGYGTVPSDDDLLDLAASGGGPSVRQVIQQQDEGLDSLHQIIVRQRHVAENIESEVGTQNDLIDGLGDDLDQTNVHLLSTTQRVQVVNRTSGVWRYWAVIILLLVVILIIVCIPS